MPVGTVILLRHARSNANNEGVLAGRAEGIGLDETGAAQAEALVGRLAGAGVVRLVSSPLLRCRQTLQPLASAVGLAIEPDERITEVDYGEWSGRRLDELTADPLWRTVQFHPAAMVFPGGEEMAAVSARAVQAARGHAAAAGDAGAVVLCSHGDVIKAVLADALGLHLDSFQRIVVGPASVSVVRYTPLRAFVERVNDTGSLAGLGSAPDPQPADRSEGGGGDGRAGGDGPGGRPAEPAGDGAAEGQWPAGSDGLLGGDPGRGAPPRHRHLADG